MLGDNCFIGVSIAKSPAFIGRQMPGAVPGCGKTCWVKGNVFTNFPDSRWCSLDTSIRVFIDIQVEHVCSNSRGLWNVPLISNF